jgi:small subunit ribosomal protein S6
MPIYESCVILSPKLADPEIDATVDKLKDILVAGGAEIREVARWGRRKLAYLIEKFEDGFYVVLFYKLDKAGQTLVNFDRACKYDDNILRSMTLKLEEKKKGQPIKPLVPSPGYLAEFSMKLRPHAPRRRPDGDRGRYGDRGPAREAPPVEAPPEPVAAEPVGEESTS